MKTEAERFWEKVEKGDICWTWTASTRRGGYGQFWSREQGYVVSAHRWAYEHLVGPIPEGLFLDHLCRNPRCVNPGHLEPVTNAENLRRGHNPVAINARKTHCPKGHEYVEENTYVVDGKRRCKTCANARTRDARQRTLERDPEYDRRRYREKEEAANNRCPCGAKIGSRGKRCRSCNNKLMWAKRRGDSDAMEQLEGAWRNVG